LIQFNIQFYANYEEAKEEVEDVWVAVFDDYIMRGYHGKMMVIVNDNALCGIYTWQDGVLRHTNDFVCQ
jgi:hypothetical protein